MDNRDSEIIAALIANSRVSYTELSKQLGISEVAVRKRVKKLETEGIIQKFTTIIDPAVLGFNVIALIGVDAHSEALTRTYDLLRKIKNLKSIALSSGDHMIMLEVWCKNNAELSKLVARIQETEGVTRVCPAVLLRNRELIE